MAYQVIDFVKKIFYRALGGQRRDTLVAVTRQSVDACS